jgi:hypothetical protein
MKTLLYCACLSALSLSVFGPNTAIAQSGAKQTPARSIPVKKVFPFYDMYLSLPPEGRDGFRMEYGLPLPAGSPRPQMTYVLGNARTAVEIGPRGRIINMPDANMLNHGRIDVAANQPRTSINLNLEPLIPLSRSISAAAATNALNDYANAVRRAGPLAAFAPKLSGIVFKGSTGGEAVFADGRTIALPAEAGGVRFQPSLPALRGVVSLAFATAPSEAAFAK